MENQRDRRSGTIAGAFAIWYKQAIIGFLVLNPILLMTVGPFMLAGS